jgi:gamma-glutamyl phosphate reductase
VLVCSELSSQMIGRLTLSDSKLDSLVAGIRSIADSEDPIGQLRSKTELSEKLVLEKITCPIGS